MNIQKNVVWTFLKIIKLINSFNEFWFYLIRLLLVAMISVSLLPLRLSFELFMYFKSIISSLNQITVSLSLKINFDSWSFTSKIKIFCSPVTIPIWCLFLKLTIVVILGFLNVFSSLKSKFSLFGSKIFNVPCSPPAIRNSSSFILKWFIERKS